MPLLLPTYWMLQVWFLWMSMWILAVIGALNLKFAPAVVFVLGLSLAWTDEVMRNVVNLTVSRVIVLYYLKGIQSNIEFCIQRALTRNLGSANLESLFVPSIEALRIVARGLNLLEGEDEFMFSCAHCCLKVMQSVFKSGNGWAYVQVKVKLLLNLPKGAMEMVLDNRAEVLLTKGDNLRNKLRPDGEVASATKKRFGG